MVTSDMKGILLSRCLGQAIGMKGDGVYALQTAKASPTTTD